MSEANNPMKNPDIDQIAYWVHTHLGARKGIPDPQIVEFVDYATPKVIIFFDLEEVPISEGAIKSHYAELMAFVKLHDNDIEALIAQKAEGEYVSQLVDEALHHREHHKRWGWLEHGFLAVIFLMVAYKLGKGVFTFAVIALGAFYTYLFIDEKNHVHLRLRRRGRSVPHENGE